MQAQDYAAELPDADFRRSHGFRRERFERLVQYVCWICEDPRALGLERLNRDPLQGRSDRLPDARPRRHRRDLRAPSRRPLGQAAGIGAARPGAARAVAQRPRVGDREPDLLVSLRPSLDLAGFDAEEISLVEAMTAPCASTSARRSPSVTRARHDPRCGAPGRGDPLFHRLRRPAGRDQRGRPRLGDPRERAAQGCQGAGAGRGAHGAPARRGRRAAVASAARSSLGAALPAGGPGSWFVYRQHGVKDARVPDLACVYRLEADELVLGGIRVAVDDEEDEDAEAAV